MASSSSSLPAPRYIHAFPAKLIRFPRRGEGRFESNLLVLLPLLPRNTKYGTKFRPSFDSGRWKNEYESVWKEDRCKAKRVGGDELSEKKVVGHAAEDKNDRWKRRDVLLFSLFPSPLLCPPPLLSLIVSTNRKVENYYGSKSIRLPRVIGVSCPSRNSLLTYLFTALRAWKITLVRSIPESFGRDNEFFPGEISIEQMFLFFFFFLSCRKFESNNDRFEIISLLIKFFRSDRGEERRKEERKKNNFPRVIESSWRGG